jgi:hypothetical protein
MHENLIKLLRFEADAHQNDGYNTGTLFKLLTVYSRRTIKACNAESLIATLLNAAEPLARTQQTASDRFRFLQPDTHSSILT